ncbi:MAG: hypothetical protein M1831_003229 [Alyxoria varia]|nr:MAG: hypothetical protein M1831_003229 [Alyxoria varia]
MLQARQLGSELYVGIHSDEDILEHKGPTVMNLKERISAADACRWVTKSIPHAPYVTSLPWITHYGCQYVVHGDDITSDSDGQDCYRYVKTAGRFKVVKRTPGISTTDLVGRMLLCTKTHFIRSLKGMLEGKEGPNDEIERKGLAEAMNGRLRAYASDESGLRPGVDVLFWHADHQEKGASAAEDAAGGTFSRYFKGKDPKPGQRIVYVDGGFDLFSSGHIEFLRSVVRVEEEKARKDGWYEDGARRARVKECGCDYGRAFVVAGVHDDEVINRWKGLNYPIMNVYERGLCVLQCKYIHSLILGAPFSPSIHFLSSLPYQSSTENKTPISRIYHGPTSFMPLSYDPYASARALGIFEEIARHDFQEVNAAQIVERIEKGRERFEERQRVKGVKGGIEEGIRGQG